VRPNFPPSPTSRSQNSCGKLSGDPEFARQEIQKRIKSLVLTPKETPEGPVLEVSSDVALLRTGDVLVESPMDEAHYVRYDFSTATKLLEVCQELKLRSGTMTNLDRAGELSSRTCCLPAGVQAHRPGHGADFHARDRAALVWGTSFLVQAGAADTQSCCGKITPLLSRNCNGTAGRHYHTVE
jgi:hypothetical protein